jgi:hypothetical protein
MRDFLPDCSSYRLPPLRLRQRRIRACLLRSQFMHRIDWTRMVSMHSTHGFYAQYAWFLCTVRMFSMHSTHGFYARYACFLCTHDGASRRTVKLNAWCWTALRRMPCVHPRLRRRGKQSDRNMVRTAGWASRFQPRCQERNERETANVAAFRFRLNNRRKAPRTQPDAFLHTAKR